MVGKLNKIQRKLEWLLPNCYIKYGPNFYNKELVDFFIYFDRRKKYLKVSIIKDKIDKINIRILAKDIKTIMNKQYYGIESKVVIFDEFIGEETKCNNFSKILQTLFRLWKE